MSSIRSRLLDDQPKRNPMLRLIRDIGMFVLSEKEKNEKNASKTESKKENADENADGSAGNNS